jgi:hypothetical protein
MVGCGEKVTERAKNHFSRLSLCRYSIFVIRFGVDSWDMIQPSTGNLNQTFGGTHVWFPLAFRRLVLLPSLVWQLTSFAEDVKLREEAVRLMEKANQVSLPGVMPTYEHTVTFTVHYPDGAKVSKFPSRCQGEGRRGVFYLHSILLLCPSRVPGGMCDEGATVSAGRPTREQHF